MRSLLLGLALLFALPSWVEAQPLPRVGDSIDEAERLYFGFFRDLDDIEAVDVEQGPEGGLVFRIQHAGESTERALSAEQKGTLVAYLENHEEQATIESLDFEDLSGIVRYRAWYQDGTPVDVALMDGERVGGRLLTIDPDRLVIWRGTDSYRWDAVGDRVRVLRTDEIVTVVSSQTQIRSRVTSTALALGVGAANLALGAGTYFLADALPVQGAPAMANTVLSSSIVFGMGGSTALYGKVIYGRPEEAARLTSLLQEGAAFARERPPELIALPTPPPAPSRPTLKELRARTVRNGFALSVGGTYLLGGDESLTGFYADGNQRVPLEVVRKPPAAWYVDASVGLLPRFRVGANLLAATRAPAAPWEGYSHGTTVTGYAEFDIKPHDPLFLTPSGRWGVSLAAGASHSWVSTGLDYEFAAPLLTLDPTLASVSGKASSASMMGGFGRVTARYFVSNALSVDAALSYRSRSSVGLEGEERTYQTGSASGAIYRYDDFTSTFPPLDLFVGTRWHF